MSRRILPLLFAATLACSAPPASEDPTPVATDAEKAQVVRFWELFRTATTQRLDGQLQDAAGTYEQALELNPRHEDSLYYLGQCQQDLGRYDSALQAFERLVEVNPRSARGHLALGSLLSYPDPSAPRDLARAEEAFRTAQSINAEETGAALKLGELRLVRGDPDEAQDWLEAAYRTNHRSVEALFLTAYLRHRAGDPDGAWELYRKAVATGQEPPPPVAVPGEGDTRPGAGHRVERVSLLSEVAVPAPRPDGSEPESLEEIFEPLATRLRELQDGTEPLGTVKD